MGRDEMAPSVCIVTRTRDRPAALNRTLGDVLAQRYQDWQLVLVNDAGNVRKVEETVEPYRAALGGRCVVLHREQSTGQGAAANFGIANSKSRYLVLHDDDDSWHPDFLQRCMERLEADSAYAGAATGAARLFERFDGECFTETGREPMRRLVEPITLRSLQRRNLWPPIAFVYARSAADTVGHYRNDVRILADWDFNVRFARRFRIAAIPDVLAFWHIRRVQAANDTYANMAYRGHLDDLMRLKREWGQIPPLWRYLLWWRY
jgi:glycosyltransferase involved in cell wall biosynthesis